MELDHLTIDPSLKDTLGSGARGLPPVLESDTGVTPDSRSSVNGSPVRWLGQWGDELHGDASKAVDLCQGFRTVSRVDLFLSSGRGCGAAVVV